MFDFLRRGRKPVRAASHRSRRNALRLEVLEDRKLLAGVVSIDLSTAGTIRLVGDGDDNQVVVRQAIDANTYLISRPADSSTLFQLKGSPVTLESIAVNGINGDITVALGDGDDSFDFLEAEGGGRSDVPEDLFIDNDDGSDKNVLSNVYVHGDLMVTKVNGSSGRSEFTLLNSIVVGDTLINNRGRAATGGSTKTLIDSSELQGGGTANKALELINGEATDMIDIRGNSQFGTGTFISSSKPIVRISNGAGGSRTTFTGASNIAGPGTTTIYGDVAVENTFNIQGTSDIVTFNKVNVLGDVDVNNGDGTTNVMVLDSTLGSYLKPNLGGKLSVVNGAGHDEFLATGSQLPYGVLLDHGTGAQNWGSSNVLAQSSVGSLLGNNDKALEIRGDNGADEVLLQAVEFRGTVDLDTLRNGSNDVQIVNQSIVPNLVIEGGSDNDHVLLNDSSFPGSVSIKLNAGSDSLEIIDVDAATEWPSPLLGGLVIDGGTGIDRISKESPQLGALGFELII